MPYPFWTNAGVVPRSAASYTVAHPLARLASCTIAGIMPDVSHRHTLACCTTARARHYSSINQLVESHARGLRRAISEHSHGLDTPGDSSSPARSGRKGLTPQAGPRVWLYGNAEIRNMLQRNDLHLISHANRMYGGGILRENLGEKRKQAGWTYKPS